MSEITDVFLNDPAYNLTTRDSEWINVSIASYLTYTIECSADCDYGFRWAVDDGFSVIQTDTKSIVGGTSDTFFVPKKARYCQFFVDNIAVTPCSLKLQAFFFLKNNLGLTNLMNVGGGSELFIEGSNELRTVESSDGSVIITQNADTINFQTTSSGDVTLTSAGGSQTLVNNGVSPNLAIKGLNSSGTVSMVSDANSITISGASTDVTLSSVGGGQTLINDGVGPALATKSLQAGTGVSLSSTGSTITINNTATISPFTQSGQYITPVTLTDTSLIGGIGNTIDSTTRRCLVWGTNCSTKFSNGLVESYGILCSTTSGVTGPNGGKGNSSGVIFSTDSYQHIEGTLGITENSGIFCSRGCLTLDAGGNDRACLRSAIIGGYNCRIGGIGSVTRNSEQVGILFSENCVCDNYTGTCCTAILASHGSELGTQAPTGVLADMLTIIGCEDCTLGIVDNGERYIDALFNSRLSQIDGYSRLCAVINSDGSSMTGIEQYPAEMNTLLNCTNSSVDAIFGANGQARRNIIINGRNSSVRYEDNVIIGSGTCIAHKGNFMATDSLTGLTSVANDRCTFKFSGGYTFYSNDLQTTGVQVSASGGSWASICDVNKKENLKELDYNKVLLKLEKLPIYQFNYKGVKKEQINYSPTAQDYHRQFQDDIADIDYEKDKLVIESMDAIGLCMAAIKGLKEIVDDQQKLIKELNNRIWILENQN